jgi:hypothetical protein
MARTKSSMTPDLYEKAMQEWGLSRAQQGAFWGCSDRSARDWAQPDKGGPPSGVALMIHYMLAMGLSPEQIAQEVEEAFPDVYRGLTERVAP